MAGLPSRGFRIAPPRHPTRPRRRGQPRSGTMRPAAAAWIRGAREELMSQSETYQKGAAMRRRLLGDEWVDRTAKTRYADPRMKTFIDVATEAVFRLLRS